MNKFLLSIGLLVASCNLLAAQPDLDGRAAEKVNEGKYVVPQLSSPPPFTMSVPVPIIRDIRKNPVIRNTELKIALQIYKTGSEGQKEILHAAESYVPLSWTKNGLHHSNFVSSISFKDPKDIADNGFFTKFLSVRAEPYSTNSRIARKNNGIDYVTNELNKVSINFETKLSHNALEFGTEKDKIILKEGAIFGWGGSIFLNENKKDEKVFSDYEPNSGYGWEMRVSNKI